MIFDRELYHKYRTKWGPHTPFTSFVLATNTWWFVFGVGTIGGAILSAVAAWVYP